MEPAQTIRSAVTRVAQLRADANAHPPLRAAVKAIKALQARRFAGTYADLLAGPPYAAATKFFLEELYSDRDFADRDAQFARIAGAIEKFFPALVVETATNLAKLHAMTEDLDHAMAVQWTSDVCASGASRYVRAWRMVGRRADREAQLREVLAIGAEMARLTRAPGLRTMLRMMRRPASAAGLSSLQGFLETGFDTFAAMARGAGAAKFLDTISRREGALIALLFDADLVACETELASLLGQAP